MSLIYIPLYHPLLSSGRRRRGVGGGSGLVGGGVLGVLSLALVADLSYETVAVVHVLDGLLAAVGEVDGVAALGLVAVAGLRGGEVRAGVAVGDAVVVGVLRGDLEG